MQENAPKGRTFPSLDAQNQHLQEWESRIADTRIHGTTKKQVLTSFNEAERAARLPLPLMRFDTFRDAKRKFSRDGHVEVAKAFYSMPGALKAIGWCRASSRSPWYRKSNLVTILRLLRLSGLAASLDVRIQEAQASRLSHLEFLELILQDEVAVRDHRRIDRRTKFAGFRDLKTLDQFDWKFNTSLPRRQLFELATCKFLDDDPTPGPMPAENPKLAGASTGNRRPKPAPDADDETDQTATT